MKERGSFNKRFEKSIGESFKASLKVNGAFLSSFGRVIATKQNRELAALKIHQSIGHPRIAALISNLILK